MCMQLKKNKKQKLKSISINIIQVLKIWTLKIKRKPYIVELC